MNEERKRNNAKILSITFIKTWRIMAMQALIARITPNFFLFFLSFTSLYHNLINLSFETIHNSLKKKWLGLGPKCSQIIKLEHYLFQSRANTEQFYRKASHDCWLIEAPMFYLTPVHAKILTDIKKLSTKHRQNFGLNTEKSVNCNSKLSIVM